MSKDQYNLSIKNSEELFIAWCQNEEIDFNCIHYVITWEEWDDGIGVFIFLKSMSDVDELDERMKQKIQKKHSEFLKLKNYPFKKFPNVVYVIDSDENVQKNFGGSYFARLR